MLILIAGALWGTAGVNTRLIYAQTETNALAIAAWRLALAVPGLAAITLLTRQASVFRQPTWQDAAALLGLGIAQIAYQVLYFAAIPYVGVAVATLIALCSAPIIVAILAIPLLREPFTWALAVALALALSGTILIAGFGQMGERPLSNPLAGIALAFGSGAGYASYALISRRLAVHYPPAQITLMAFSAAALGLLPAGVATGQALGFEAEGWARLVYMGLVPTALAYWLFARGMRTTPATAASLLTLIEPLTATLLAAIVFGEQLTANILAGGALLITAVIALVRPTG
jgi:DME family drug/metabolite transporter